MTQQASPSRHTLRAPSVFSLCPRATGTLLVRSGRLWVTLGSQTPSPLTLAAGNAPGGDYFLSAGQSLTLQPGQRVVLESYPDASKIDAQWAWEVASVATSRSTVLGNLAARMGSWSASLQCAAVRLAPDLRRWAVSALPRNSH